MTISAICRLVRTSRLVELIVCMCLFGGLKFCPGQDAEAGKRLFREGILADSSKLVATVKGDLKLRGKFVACAKCHRRSGRGAQEGARLVPAIHSQSLFTEKRIDRARLFRNLYQEDHPPETDAKVSSQSLRPPYDRESLNRVLWRGIDANGRELQRLMPRYQLAEPDFSNLLAYLKELGSKASPGVNDDEIHFATVIGGEVPTSESRAMLDVLHTYADCHNLEVERYRARPNTSLNYKSEFTNTLRKWRIHVWQLEGAAETWSRQLQRQYDSEPVFAVLGGQAVGAWQPIAAFCEQNEIPCLFPNTNLPDISSDNYFTLYFHRGIYAEAELIAREIKRTPKRENAPVRVIQFYDDSAASRAGKNRLEKLLKNQPELEIESVRVPASSAKTNLAASRQFSEVQSATHVIAWLNNVEIDSLGQNSQLAESTPEIYLSGILFDGPVPKPVDSVGFKFISLPVWSKINTSPDVFRVRRWLSSRRIFQADHERIQLNTYFTCLLAKHSLRHMVADFDRNYFIEWVEHECESALNPGVFKKLSLGPGQRFATRLE